MTPEPLLAEDTDTATDVYEWAAGEVALVSTGSSGGNGAHDAFFQDISDDGTRAFFETREPLVGADADEAYDVYMRAAGQTTLVSPGGTGAEGESNAGLEDASADGSHAFFVTAGRFDSADTDEAVDLYVTAGGKTELVSPGSSDEDVYYQESSADGALAFFHTDEALGGEDTDEAGDVYLSALETFPDPALPEPQAVEAEPERGSCLGKPATVTGTSGADTLRGSAKRDVIAALGGNDRVFGNGGNDLLCAGSGNDLARGGSGNDEATGGAGADRLFGDAGIDRLFGQAGRDQAFGGGGDRDLMNGGRDADACRDSGPSRRSGCE